METPPPATHLEPVHTKHYQDQQPAVERRAKALIVNWIPHCIDQINRTDLKQGPGGIDNFVEAAKALRGQPHGHHKGYVFSNAWVHQTVESMCIALMVDPQGDPEIIKAQEKMKATLEDWIPKILAAQEPDGYLQTAFTLRNRERWAGTLVRRRAGAITKATSPATSSSRPSTTTLMTNGKDARLYDAAKKLADCWVANLGPAPRRNGSTATRRWSRRWCGSAAS